MASRYGQYCPLSIATELLGERWTILVVMQVLEGVSRFNDLQRALPKISPSTLAARLRTLEEAGLIERRGSTPGSEYHGTLAGRALEPVLFDLALWAQRFGRDMEPEDLDPEFLAWSMFRRWDVSHMPKGRVVVEFEFSDVPDGLQTGFWMLKQDDSLGVCMKHPGFDADLRVQSDLRRFVEAWRGIRQLDREIESRRIRLVGAPDLKRAFPRWLLLSQAAHVERELPGRERTTFRRSASRVG